MPPSKQNSASAELHAGNTHAHELIVEGDRAAIVARRTCRDHQRKQMFFAWVNRARAGSCSPLAKTRVTLFRIAFHRVLQPRVERFGIFASGPVAAAKPAHVVVRHAASDDEHAFVAKRRERATELDVRTGVQ